MFKIFNAFILTASCMLLLSSCTNTNKLSQKEIESREGILLKAKNYDGLVALYRDRLKQQEKQDIRFKLAQYYYLDNDSKSSLYYLQPLLKNPTVEIQLLQARNLIALDQYDNALTVANSILTNNPKNAEAHNLRGIALAEKGQLVESQQAIQRARELFIADDIALNNLAVLAMLNGRYDESARLLLPQYLKGKKEPQMIHNLVFSLVQLGDHRYAKDIIEAEKLSTNSDNLITSLSKVEKFKKATP